MKIPAIILGLAFPLSLLLADERAARCAPPEASAQKPAPAAPPAGTQPQPVTPPRLVSDATVAYPVGAKGDATVVLTLTINGDGTVRSASPAESNEPFSSQATGVALGWKFEPAVRGGQPVAATIRVEVIFHEPIEAGEPAEPAPTDRNPYDPPAGAALRPERGPGSPAASSGLPSSVPSEPPVTEVVVRGERVEPSRTATLSRAEVRQIPGTFGDPFRAIEIMPGVTPIVSGLPFFFVRGAPPGDVGYFLDGIRLPLLFHVGVGPSVVHPGLIDRVDLYPGGYPARFGRYSGGIVSGETLAPSPNLRGEYNVRLFDAGALVEAPFANERGTILLGGRYSYTATLLSLLAAGVKLDYWDYQARATYDLTPNDRIGVFGFGSYDYLGQLTSDRTLTVFGTEFHRVDLRYDRRLGDRGKLRLALTAGLDRTQLPDDRFLRNRLGGIRSELSYRASPFALIRAGTDVQIDSYDVELAEERLNTGAAAGASLFPTRTDIAMGARADAVLKLTPRFEVTPGVRFDFYGSQGKTAVAVDPRLSTRLELSDRTRLLSAMGVAQQPPAFIVPIPGFQPGGLKGGLQRALQESVGLEYEWDDTTTATATVFHNAFFNMSDPSSYQPVRLNGCIPGSLPSGFVFGDTGGTSDRCPGRIPKPGTLGSDGNAGQGVAMAAQALETRTLGTAYGVELFLKRKLTGRLGGFFSYTISRSVRSNGTNNFVANVDRTHVANAALAFNLGRNWRAGTRVVFYTGLPKAPDPSDASTRLPPFFRLDLRLEKRWQLGEKAWISFVAEWMNSTLSKEAVSTSCRLEGCDTQTVGPISIPSLGVEGGF